MFDTELFEYSPMSMDRLPLSDSERALIDLPIESKMGWLPGGLDEIAPGPLLAVLLSTVNPSRLSGHDLVHVIRARRRLASHVEARFLTDVASLSDVMIADFGDDPEAASEAAALEMRASLRFTRRRAENTLGLADDVTKRSPRIGAALAAGDIDLPKAQVMAYGTSHLPETQARKVVDQVIDDATNMTTGQLAAKLRKLCMAVDPDDAEKRYASAVEQRRLVRESTPDGSANLMIFHTAPNRAGEAFNRVDHIAQSLRSPGENRTLDQLRADVAIDLLTGRMDYKTTGRGTVDLLVDLATLAELSDEPGELAGFGPVVADIARQVAKQQKEAKWRFKVSDPETGMPIHIGTTKRRANAEQECHVELRDLTCAFPGCRMPASECDIDHIDPWVESGRTSTEALAPLCRHDHVGRHQFGWSYQPIAGGDFQWTSRLGHTYTTSGRPPPPRE